MTAIVCVSQSWGIGRDGALLFRISADHKRFRALTVGKTVILGHKTLDTFPGGKPLKDRRNIVLSHRDLDATCKGSYQKTLIVISRTATCKRICLYILQ